MTKEINQGEAQPPDLTTPEGVCSFMSGSGSEDEWNSRCDQVKEANKGYPDFWFEEVVLSGLAGETLAKWGGTDQIRISTIE